MNDRANETSARGYVRGGALHLDAASSSTGIAAIGEKI